jgi:hypothetical protein
MDYGIELIKLIGTIEKLIAIIGFMGFGIIIAITMNTIILYNEKK